MSQTEINRGTVTRIGTAEEVNAQYLRSLITLDDLYRYCNRGRHDFDQREYFSLSAAELMELIDDMRFCDLKPENPQYTIVNNVLYEIDVQTTIDDDLYLNELYQTDDEDVFSFFTCHHNGGGCLLELIETNLKDL